MTTFSSCTFVRLSILFCIATTATFAYPHSHLEAERRSQNFEAPGEDVALGHTENDRNSEHDEEPQDEIPISQEDLVELQRLRDYPELYEEYLEELEELQLLDDFVYKLHSLHYTDNEILDILEQLESEAVFEANSQGYASEPEQESSQMSYNEVKRSRPGNSVRGFRYEDFDPEEEQEEEEEPEDEAESPEDDDVDEELKRSNDIDDDLESEFENLRDEMDEAEQSEEEELADEEEMVESELNRDEAESAELMAELEQMEDIAQALREDGWSDAEIREVFREKFGIDLLFDDDEELEGFYGNEDDDEEKHDDEDEVKRGEDEEEDEDDEEDDEEDEEDELDEEVKKEDDEDDDEEESDEGDEEDDAEDEFEPMESDEFYRHYPSVNQIREYLAEHPEEFNDEEEDESEMRQRAYPFRKRALEEIKAKKQDLDQDNEGIAGENFWLGSEGNDESGEEKKGVKRLDRDMENIYNRLGYLEFQPH